MAKPQFSKANKKSLSEVEFLFDIFTDLSSSRDNWKSFITDLLTESELRMISHRWYVARLLSQGQSVRQAATKAGVGTDTVMRIARRIENGTGGLRKALLRAEVKDKKILKSELIGAKPVSSLKYSSKGIWIFGSNEDKKNGENS